MLRGAFGSEYPHRAAQDHGVVFSLTWMVFFDAFSGRIMVFFDAFSDGLRCYRCGFGRIAEFSRHFRSDYSVLRRIMVLSGCFEPVLWCCRCGADPWMVFSVCSGPVDGVSDVFQVLQ